MKNVTISMSDELHYEVRVLAAKAGLSVSKYIADRLRESEPNVGDAERTRERLAALERFIAGPKLPISENGRMPTPEERNAR